jgi:hypothetical protein
VNPAARSASFHVPKWFCTVDCGGHVRPELSYRAIAFA